nr:peptidoglycan recognition family protein [Lactococcus garvieae]
MNYGSRNGFKIDKIIIHHNATTSKDVAMNTWLVGGAAGTSAHYEITPTEIIGCVGEEYAAFHAGGTGGSDIPKISNPNQRSIGLEHVNSSGAPSWSVDDKTIDNSARLIADICKRYGLQPNSSTIIGHGAVTATACPGGLNMSKLINLAQSYYNGASQSTTNTNNTTNQSNTNQGDNLMKFIQLTDGTYKNNQVLLTPTSARWVTSGQESQGLQKLYGLTKMDHATFEGAYMGLVYTAKDGKFPKDLKKLFTK